MKSRTITVDTSVGACYIALSDCPVTRTEEFSDDVLVDLNEYGVAVGIEILDLTAQLPLTDLCRQLHIHSSDEPYLVKLLPNLRYSLRFTLRSAAIPRAAESWRIKNIASRELAWMSMSTIVMGMAQTVDRSQAVALVR